MEFKRVKRNAELFLKDEWREWRLASVDEVRNNMERIRKEEILDSWDIARLLDGWVDGPGYRYNCKNDYKPHMGHMLLVKTSVPTRWPDGEFTEEMFSGVELSREGMKAALLLSCDDKIIEVMCFVLTSILNKFKQPNQRQEELDFLTQSLKATVNQPTNILLWAADQPFNGNNAKLVANFLKEFEYGKEMIKHEDKYGRTAVHFAALHGHIHLCTFLIDQCGLKADAKDRNGENVLHFAVNTNNVDTAFLAMREEMKNLVDKPDVKGRTPLHKAAANGYKQIIGILLRNLPAEAGRVENCIRHADWSGRTALLEAAKGGHLEAVEYLLERGSSPLLERTSEGKTALHYSVQIADKKDVAYEMSTMLIKHYKSDEEKLLLLYASAKGMGTAEQIAEPDVHDFLRDQKESAKRSSSDLLLSAVKLGYEALAWELINRGADTHHIDHKEYSKNGSLGTVEQQRVQKFVKHVETMPDGGRDQPTIHDSLGRKVFAEGLAALFLNPYVKSPVTVGISGDWGMGKSSLMLQTEMILVQAAAQLAFPNILPVEDFPGSKEYVLTPKGRRKYTMVEHAVKDLLPSSEKDEVGDPLVHFLDNYQDKYPQVYKSLALMDRAEMFQLKDKQADSRQLGKIPTILTVHYNAWHYQNELEAWAGLAITITKEMEEATTRSQRIRSRCNYAWKEHGNKILFEFLLPFLFALFISFWVTSVVWLLLKKMKNPELENLKYGSIPVSLVVVFWTMLRQMHSVFQPVSVQIMGYVSADGHSKNLGYQHQVISDINFLKNQISEKPNWFWRFLACNWFWRMCRRGADTVKDTFVPKPSSLSKDIRIIVFVDDLDRCHDTVILQMLSAINLVLAACEINVIVGMDKKMIARAIAHKYKDYDNLNEVDIAEKYLSKIVQLPLALPDFSNEEIMKFLDQQLGKEESPKTGGDAAGSSQLSPGAQPMSVESSHEEDNTKPLQDLEIGDRGNHPQKGTERRSIINQLRNFLKQLISNFLLKCILHEPPGDQPSVESSHAEDNTRTPQGPDKKSLKLKSTPINSQLILPTYGDEERKVIAFLSQQAPHALQIPRDWKRFLTYFRLAWNILSQLKQVKNIAGWQVQLLVWTFCCWQWKENINLIVKKWKDLIMSIRTGAAKDEEISLKIIVEHCLDNFKDLDEKIDKKRNARPILKNLKELVPAQSGSVEDEDQSQKNLGEHYLDNMQEEASEEDSWQLLKNTLGEYDVPLESILAFQKFRLHCEIGYLAPPKNSTDIAIKPMISTSIAAQPMSSTTTTEPMNSTTVTTQPISSTTMRKNLQLGSNSGAVEANITVTITAQPMSSTDTATHEPISSTTITTQPAIRSTSTNENLPLGSNSGVLEANIRVTIA